MFALLLALLIAQDPQEIQVRSGPYHPPSPGVLSAEANLVEFGVTVRNRKGDAVGGLKASDFEVIDKGSPQKITFFEERRIQRPADVPNLPVTPGRGISSESSAAAPAPRPPRTVALFFDDSRGGVLLGRSRAAAEKLINGLAPEVAAGIFTDSATVEVNFTHDRKALLEALARIKPHSLIGARGYGQCPTLTAYQAYVIANHIDPDAKELALNEVIGCLCHLPTVEECRSYYSGITDDMADNTWNLLKSQSVSTLDVLGQVVQALARAPGERTLIMISPGLPTGGMEKQSNAIIDAALRAHIVISGLDSEGLIGSAVESPESFGTDRGARFQWARRTLGQRQLVITEVMSSMAAASGGRFIANSNDLAAGLQTLSAEPDVSYRLAFSPASEPDNKYHPLKVLFKNDKNHQLQFRPGYFSSVAKETAQQRIDRKVASTETLSEIPIELHIARDGAAVQIEIRVDAHKIPFEEKSGRRVQELTFVTVVRDARGQFVSGTETVMDLALTPVGLVDLQAKGIHSNATFSLPHGTYTVREVVREAVHDYFAALNTPLDLR